MSVGDSYVSFRCIWPLALVVLDAFAPLKRPRPGGQAQYGPKGCAWGIQKTICALDWHLLLSLDF